MPRALVVIAAMTGLAGCPTCKDDPPPATSAPRPAAPPIAAGSRSRCTAETLTPASRILTAAHHPCRGWIEAVRGRAIRAGAGFSGTIVSTAAQRGGGLVATCAHCAIEPDGAGVAPPPAGLVDPEREPPVGVPIPPIAAAAAADVAAAPVLARRLFGPAWPAAPGADVVLAALPGPRRTLDDPRGLAGSRAPFVEPRAGAAVLVLGFADAQGSLVASVGPILDEAAARDRLGRAPSERAAPFDPAAELVIAARATPGMEGGGVFDDGGRLVGVIARAVPEPVDGAYLVRAVRATAIAARLSAALGAAPVPLRTRVAAYLP